MGRPDRIPVRCPNCGTGLRAPLQFAGKRAKCRVCGGKVPIPALVENVVADPVIEAEALDDDATELMSVEELVPEYEAKPPLKLPPRDEPESDEEEDDAPRPKRRRRPDDADDEDRPRRRKSASKIPLGLIIAGVVLLLLAAASVIGGIVMLTSG
jgi:hypothetical protein